MCLLSSVEFLKVLVLNDLLWLANLDLNSVSVSPTYVSALSLSGLLSTCSFAVTVAW